MKVGDIIESIDPNYNQLPGGVKSVFVMDWVPPGHMVMVKDRKIIGIFARNPDKVDELRELTRQCDGLICNPVDSPEQIMGSKWTKEAVERTKKLFS